MKVSTLFFLLALLASNSFASENFVKDCKNLLTTKSQKISRSCYSQEDESRAWVEITNGGSHLGPNRWQLFEIEYDKSKNTCKVLNKYLEDIHAIDADLPGHAKSYKIEDSRYGTRVFINEMSKKIESLIDDSSESVNCVDEKRTVSLEKEVEKLVVEVGTDIGPKLEISEASKDVKVNSAMGAKEFTRVATTRSLSGTTLSR